MNPLFTSGGQSIGASVSASVLPVNIRTDFLVGSPCCPGTLAGTYDHDVIWKVLASWIIWWGLNPTGVLVGEEDAEEGCVKMEAEIGRCSHKPRKTQGHRSYKRQEGPSLGEGSGALRYLHFGLLTSRP